MLKQQKQEEEHLINNLLPPPPPRPPSPSYHSSSTSSSPPCSPHPSFLTPSPCFHFLPRLPAFPLLPSAVSVSSFLFSHISLSPTDSLCSAPKTFFFFFLSLLFLVYLFRHTRVSSTYPCLSVRPSVGPSIGDTFGFPACQRLWSPYVKS